MQCRGEDNYERAICRRTRSLLEFRFRKTVAQMTACPVEIDRRLAETPRAPTGLARREKQLPGAFVNSPRGRLRTLRFRLDDPQDIGRITVERRRIVDEVDERA